ncbi:MAG: regulatory protein RecX [Clostridia bacterium]|nr:regulatory protein RecX [Clostridia bacterium]
MVITIRKYKKPEGPLGYDAAKDKALRLLAFRAHSEYELADKLAHAGAPSEVIDEVMEFLREYNLVDDRIYAERLARDLQNVKKFAKHRIIAELSRKGISREIAYEVTEELDADEEEMLLPQMEKKLGGDFDRKSRDRAFRYFAARGYSFDDIKRAFDRIASGEYDD